MVFEGKLIHPKPAAPTAVPAKPVLTKPVTTETAIPPPPAPKKKESHFFRNLFLYTIGLTVIAYAGGVYYSLDDDAFRDVFTEQVPYAENIVYFIEEQRFKRKFSNSLPSVESASTDGSTSTITSSKTTSTASRAATPAAWTSAEHPSGAPKPSPKKKVEPAPAAPTAYKPTSDSALPFIRVPSGVDASVAHSIEGLNHFIKLVNESKAIPADIDALSKEINSLADTIDSIKAEAKAEAEKKAAAVVDVSQTEERLESTIAEIKTALNEQEEKWAREYHEETKRLTQAHNDRLQAEVEARSKVIFAHVNNQLAAIHNARDKEFSQQIADRIENERDGRLSKLQDLSNQLSEVQELAVKATEIIQQSDRAAKMQLAVTRFRVALESDEPIPLAPYFDTLKQLVDLKKSNDSADADSEFLSAVLNSIPKDVLTQGVLSPAQLVARFHLLEPELRSASLVPPNAGILGHFGSLVLSKLLWKKEGSPEGEDVEAVLSRANTALSEGRITDAVVEVNSLKGWPKKLAGDWLAEGRKRSEIEFLIDLLAEDGKLYY